MVDVSSSLARIYPVAVQIRVKAPGNQAIAFLWKTRMNRLRESKEFARG